MNRVFGGKILIALGTVALLGSARLASADTFSFDLTIGNAALAGFPTPFATVTVNRSSTTAATVTFSANDPAGQYDYWIGAAQALDINVNGTATATDTTPATLSTNQGSQNADGWGSFNVTFDNFDGNGSAFKTSTITLAATGATSWSSASTVLTNNASGNLAAAHIFVRGATQPQGGALSGDCPDGVCNTGFATNGPSTPVPEPTSLLLLGTGMFGAAGAFARRRRAKK